MPKLIDERFHKYGRLTVLNQAGYNKSGHAMWFCRCDCGNFTITTGTNLRKGYTQSCGCLVREKASHLIDTRKLPEGEASFNNTLGHMKFGAKKRNLEWTLSDKQARYLLSQPCYYCGAQPKIHKNTHSLNGDFPYTGLDRMDNSKGYLLGNVVSCCPTCNFMKHVLSLSDFKKHIIKIYNYLNLQTENKEES